MSYSQEEIQAAYERLTAGQKRTIDALPEDQQIAQMGRWGALLPPKHDIPKLQERLGADSPETVVEFLLDLQSMNDHYNQKIREWAAGDNSVVRDENGVVVRDEKGHLIVQSANDVFQEEYMRDYGALLQKHGVMPAQQDKGTVYWFNPGAPAGIDAYGGEAELSGGPYQYTKDQRSKNRGGQAMAAVVRGLIGAGAGFGVTQALTTATSAAGASSGALSAASAPTWAQAAGSGFGNLVQQANVDGDIDWGRVGMAAVTPVAVEGVGALADRAIEGGVGDAIRSGTEYGSIGNRIITAGVNASVGGLLQQPEQGSESTGAGLALLAEGASRQQTNQSGRNHGRIMSSPIEVGSPGQYNGEFEGPMPPDRSGQQAQRPRGTASEATRQEYLSLVNETVRSGQKTPEQESRLRHLRSAVLSMTPFRAGAPRG